MSGNTLFCLLLFSRYSGHDLIASVNSITGSLIYVLFLSDSFLLINFYFVFYLLFIPRPKGSGDIAKHFRVRFIT